jgi:hypothetical protein
MVILFLDNTCKYALDSAAHSSGHILSKKVALASSLEKHALARPGGFVFELFNKKISCFFIDYH